MEDNNKDVQIRAKKEYDFLKENGDLEILFPDLTGKWKEDKE